MAFNAMQLLFPFCKSRHTIHAKLNSRFSTQTVIELDFQKPGTNCINDCYYYRKL